MIGLIFKNISFKLQYCLSLISQVVLYTALPKVPQALDTKSVTADNFHYHTFLNLLSKFKIYQAIDGYTQPGPPVQPNKCPLVTQT